VGRFLVRSRSPVTILPASQRRQRLIRLWIENLRSLLARISIRNRKFPSALLRELFLLSPQMQIPYDFGIRWAIWLFLAIGCFDSVKIYRSKHSPRFNWHWSPNLSDPWGTGCHNIRICIPTVSEQKLRLAYSRYSYKIMANSQGCRLVDDMECFGYWVHAKNEECDYQWAADKDEGKLCLDYSTIFYDRLSTRNYMGFVIYWISRLHEISK